MTLSITSTAFEHEGEMPAKYTCEGKDICPPLAWDGVPQGTQSLALIIDDPDAPDPEAPTMNWVHWILYNLPPDTTGLAEGATLESLPVGTEAGKNDWAQTWYGGPCPPIGKHRYFHKLYALDCILEGLYKPEKADVEAAMQGHILDQAVLMGTYIKAGQA